MKKRILSMLLALVLMVGLLPVRAEADDSDAVDYVEKQIRAYADTIDLSGADTDAAKVLAVHGMTGNGKKLEMDERDSLTAVLMNSEMVQYGLADIFVEILGAGQRLDIQTIPGVNMCFVWRGRETFYWADMIVNSDLGAGAEKLNWRKVDKEYTQKLNHYDESLDWMVGSVDASATISCVRNSEYEKTYHVELTFNDRFDFSIANTSGFKYLMSGLGMLMFEEFDWSCKVEFEMNVPWHEVDCSHGTENYHWTLDNGNHAMISDGSGAYTMNAAKHKTKTKNDGLVRHYYELERTVRLLHNQPWVLEYDAMGLKQVSFEPVENAVTQTYPCIRQYGAQNLYLVTKEYVMEPKPNKGGQLDRYYTYNYYGTGLQFPTSYSENKKYTFRFENVIASDGSNMIYLSVYNADNGEVCMEQVPMDDYFYQGEWMSKKELRDKNSDYAVGRDILINYIGSDSHRLEVSYLDIRIWENGKDTVKGSYLEQQVVKPTCTESGEMIYTCSRCGYLYADTVVSATGHSYEDYVFDNNATCTADGTQTRTCSVCGEKETVTASGTALGHDYKSVVTAPTLTAEGYTTYTCTRCGDSYKDDFVAKKEHTYVGVVTEPTCTEQGYTTYTCSECGDSYVDDYTDMIEHTPVIDPAVEPTCVEKGKTEGSHCGVCGFVIKKQANISTVNRHDFEEEITKIPTYDEDGEVTYTCKDCGKVETKTIPAFEKPTPKNPFTDVSEGDWFYGPVIWALKEGVTGGKTETTFAPNEGCTRAQVVTFLWAANGKPEPESMDNPFNDVADDAWYLKPVLWAVEQGITGGVAEGMFGPEQTCTRAQIATFLWAANGKHGVSSSSTFSDVNDTEWYATPVIWAVENDVTSGIGGGKFGPNDTCTRAQVVTFLYKVYGNK